MRQEKICLIGAPSVGKTSLMRRFVVSQFDDQYLTTIGAKVDSKIVVAGGENVMLVIWDIEGSDAFRKISWSYMRSAKGFFLVADGTRPHTLDAANKIYQRTREVVGPIPFTLLLNKADLLDDWMIDDGSIGELRGKGWPVLKTSAKSGSGVEEAFLQLTQKMLENQ